MRFFRRIRKLVKDDHNPQEQINRADVILPQQNEKSLSNEKSTVALKPKILTVNIGIDFGTSCTKVCFEGNHEFDFVVLDNAKYIPSVVYYEYIQKQLYFKEPKNSKNIEKIEYFKYSMIASSLPKGKYLSESGVNESPEELCCIFYIACLIKEIKAFIVQYYNKKFTIDWNINMGVPVDNYDTQHKSRYDKILHVAIKLSNVITENNCTLEFLDGFFQENKEILIPRFQESPFNTLPELYAECLYFLKDRNVVNGVYAIVDVGGGTVDMAVVYKESPKTFSIVSKDIQPLGIEIVAHNISINLESYNDIKKALQDNNFEKLEKFNEDKKREFAKSMSEMFARLAIEVKTKKWSREALIKQKGKLRVILCGGGASYKWYESCISATRDRLRKALVIGYELEIMPPEKLIGSSKVKDHRLIIARCLAQRIEDIPEVSGFPWHFPENRPVCKIDDRTVLEEIAKEKYGEPI